MANPAETTNRHLVMATADVVIRRLPTMGKLMIIGKANGATHERIGVVEQIGEADGWLTATSPHHDSKMDPRLVCRIVLDTSGIIQDQVYLRLEFQDGNGDTLFACVGFEGAALFEAATEDLRRTKLQAAAAAERPTRPDVADDDAGMKLLTTALTAARPITILFESAGFKQSWTGCVEKVSPAMGFINVLHPDFHLHLLGSAVASWDGQTPPEGFRLRAINDQEKAIGLTISAADETTLIAGETE